MFCFRMNSSKSDAINESVLSFDKQEATLESNVATTPTRTSKRSSSKRASLAITDLVTSRKSLRSKNT